MTHVVEHDGDLRIIAATSGSLDAEDIGGDALAACLGLKPPLDWPPEHNDAPTRDWVRALLRDTADSSWATWYIVVDDRPVGICGFKGAPNDAGEVEIGYSVVGREQRRGHASRAIGLLLRRAFREPHVSAVVAETLPHLTPSRRVLEKHGFTLESSRQEEGLGEVIGYRLERP